MSRRTPTRIELHRLKHHWLGKRSALIPFHRLDPEEKKLVAEDVLTSIHANGGEDPYRVYADVLAAWGVVCPHPQHMRRYSGKIRAPYFPLTDHRWYDCDVCECSIFNEDFSPGRSSVVG